MAKILVIYNSESHNATEYDIPYLRKEAKRIAKVENKDAINIRWYIKVYELNCQTVLMITFDTPTNENLITCTIL